MRDKRDILALKSRDVFYQMSKTCNFISGTMADIKYSKMATVLVFSLSFSLITICNGPLKPGT